MEVIIRTKHIKKKFTNPVIAIGNFDGVHLGHIKVLQKVLKEARKFDGDAIALTFNPHPIKVLKQSKSFYGITTLEEKIIEISKTGLDYLLIFTFSKEFASFSAEVFAEKILKGELNVRKVIIGYNFTFGHKGEGDGEKLKLLGNKFGFEVEIFPSQKMNGEEISSSAIRTLILSGNIKKASLFLGKNYSIKGKVIKGAGIGKKLGFPTANLLPEKNLLPPYGVYATITKINGISYKSVTSLGTRPTFKGEIFCFETFIFDFNKKIYGERIDVEFVDKIRDEIVFSSKKELISQIESDIIEAKKVLRETYG